MRTLRIAYVCLVAAMLAGLPEAGPAALSLSPSGTGIMDLTSFGFPATLMDPYGLPVTAGIRSPDSAMALSSYLLSATSGPSGLASFMPDTAMYGTSWPASLDGLAAGVPPSALASVPGFTGGGVPSLLSRPDMGSLSMAGLSPGSGAYTETSNGKTIKVKLGDTIHVQLKARMDQGYVWNLTITPGLNQSSEQAYPPDDMNLFSGAGISGWFTQDWGIKAIGNDTQTITGIYKVSSSDGPPDKTFTLTVIVE